MSEREGDISNPNSFVANLRRLTHIYKQISQIQTSKKSSKIVSTGFAEVLNTSPHPVIQST